MMLINREEMVTKVMPSSDGDDEDREGRWSLSRGREQQGMPNLSKEKQISKRKLTALQEEVWLLMVLKTAKGVVATVQTLTATIDPHQQQTATNYDKLMVLQGSWFAGYWFPWEEHAHRNGELKQGKAVARSNGDQSMRKMVLLIGDGSSWRCSVRMQVVLVLN